MEPAVLYHALPGMGYYYIKQYIVPAVNSNIIEYTPGIVTTTLPKGFQDNDRLADIRNASGRGPNKQAHRILTYVVADAFSILHKSPKFEVENPDLGKIKPDILFPRGESNSVVGLVGKYDNEGSTRRFLRYFNLEYVSSNNGETEYKLYNPQAEPYRTVMTIPYFELGIPKQKKFEKQVQDISELAGQELILHIGYWSPATNHTQFCQRHPAKVSD